MPCGMIIVTKDTPLKGNHLGATTTRSFGQTPKLVWCNGRRL